MADSLSGLGRITRIDPRSKNYPLPKKAVPAAVRRRTWNCPGILDQGGTSQCVAYTGFNWLRSGPITNRTLPFNCEQLYGWAQENDEWEGAGYDGTSGLGLMKALQQKGYISEYRWAFDVETIFAWLLTSGPVCMGTSWHRDMFTPGPDGFLFPTGDDDGGHEYLLIGADRDKKCPDRSTGGAVRVINSWGTGWGQNGRAWITRNDLAKLLANEGDCCTATELKVRA